MAVCLLLSAYFSATETAFSSANVTRLKMLAEKGNSRAALACRLLERYGLASFAKKRPCQLSGGMRQRCALIRTLATEPEILLLDEPFSALDYQTRLAVSADIWRILQQEGKTALLVTHDIAEAVSMSDRVVVLSRSPRPVSVVPKSISNPSPGSSSSRPISNDTNRKAAAIDSA